MKALLIKLGSRMYFDTKSTKMTGITGEALSIMKILKKSYDHVTAYTKVLDKDIKNPDFDFQQINTDHLDEYDHLFVINGNVNFFGGAEDPEQIMNYEVINKFKGKVFYILCDPALLLKQIWPSVEKKEWGSKYTEEQLNITRTDIECITQAYDVAKIKERSKKAVPFAAVHYYPMERFPLMFEGVPYNENPEWDLLYGGTFRGGRREKDMVNYYFGLKGVKAQMFGLKLKDFKKQGSLTPPEFGDPVDYRDFIKKMNTGMATVIIGDPSYIECSDLAQRIYECVQANVVCLIDSKYDPKKRVFKSDELNKFCHVNFKRDVEDRIAKLKADPSLRKHLCELQLAETAYDGWKEDLEKICCLS